MLNKNISIFENKVLKLSENILNQFVPLLNEVGLTYRIGKLRISGRTMTYKSEININFYDETGIADVIEFFIFYDGKPQASIDEIEKWLREDVNDVVIRRRKNV